MDLERSFNRSAALHDMAAELEDEAYFARRAGDSSAELEFTRLAFVKEAEAASLLRQDPTHHMHAALHLSAATLAYRCGEYKAAEKLIFHGLIADPEGGPRDELYDLLAKARFRLSLNSDAPPVENDHIVMTWQGPDADNGLAEDTALADHIKQWGALIRNTASHVNGLLFKNKGRINKSFRVLAAPPVQGSFKIAMKLMPIGPAQLPGFEIVERVNARILENFSTLGSGRLAALQSNFNDEAYYHDFMQSATDLAPDGERVTALGIEAGLNGKTQTVLFERTQEEIQSVYVPPQTQHEQEEFRLSDEVESVVGELKFADGFGHTGEIQLLAADGAKWQIQVDDGMAAKVVKPYFGDLVEVTGRRLYRDRKRNRLLLEDIRSAD